MSEAVRRIHRAALGTMLAFLSMPGQAQQLQPTVAQLQATQARLICTIEQAHKLDDGVSEIEVIAKKVLAACHAEQVAEARAYAGPGQQATGPTTLDQMNAEAAVRNSREKYGTPTVGPKEKMQGDKRL